MKVLPLAQPPSIGHHTKELAIYATVFPQWLKEVKEVRNPQSEYGDIIYFRFSTIATFIPESNFHSCLLCFWKRHLKWFETEFLGIHRINSFPSYQNVFIHRMSEIDAHFIAFRVTVTPALHAFDESCCKCDMSQKCLWQNRWGILKAVLRLDVHF